MGPRVEFVLGLGSRYSYLAATRLDALASRTGAVIEWVPVASADIIRARGEDPFSGSRRAGPYDPEYRRRDAERWAAFYGIPFIEPRPMPDDRHMMAVACRAADRFRMLIPYARALFEAIFVRHVAISEDECVSIARAFRLDAEEFRADMQQRSIRERVQADALHYVQRGAFGVPTFFVDGRMYWGNDRLMLLEHYLSTRSGHA